ncbi:MAG: ABC transporter ATP-binding protein [Bacteroidetes bacterium]|nr:ABC transporter ATP-binding protein [Bacteroidota bacterium]
MNTNEAKTLLAAAGVDKSYGQRQVLRDIHLRVREGQIVGICGENGAGKSTLLRILMGLLQPDAGTVECRAAKGYCPQQLQLFDQLTVDEHFAYYARAYGGALMNPGVRNRRIEELRDLLRMRSVNGQQVRQLSGGTQQKLNLALAMLHDPPLLILDEPYSGFDWETYLQFWAVAADLRERRKGILIVSHLVYDRSQFDLICTLENGGLTCSPQDS